MRKNIRSCAKKVLDNISIIIFFAITAVMGVCTVFFGKGFTELPRNAAEARAAVQESFPFRQNWQGLYSRCERLLGTRQFGSIFLDSENERLISVFDGGDSEQLDQNTALVNKFNARCELPCYMMLVPTASGVYREGLPDSLHAANQQSMIDEIYYELDADITPLDVFSALYSARDSYIYFRTDPHWTQLGAYEAYAAAIKKLGHEPYSLENYDVDYTHVSFWGELSQRSAVRSVAADTINAYRGKYGSYVKSTKILRERQTYTKTSVYSSTGLRSEDKYSYFLGAKDYKCVRIETASEGSPRLLVICSDYANCLAPLLAPHYSQITLVNPDMLDGSLTELVSLADFDQVLFLFDIEAFSECTGLDRL